MCHACAAGIAQRERDTEIEYHGLPVLQDHVLGLEHLERGVAIVFEIARTIHGGHAALAEVFLDQVTASEGG
ncbi:hypothetical protein, partial [Gemmatimonas sp.]|uniref:hypothetical protein n=1 Tax=Gemmatimonas sp. TaxID=1962908 RepID=UPI0037BEF53A